MKTSLEQRQPDCESAAALRCSAFVESTHATDDKHMRKRLTDMVRVYFWRVFADDGQALAYSLRIHKAISENV